MKDNSEVVTYLLERVDEDREFLERLGIYEAARGARIEVLNGPVRIEAGVNTYFPRFTSAYYSLLKDAIVLKFANTSAPAGGEALYHIFLHEATHRASLRPLAGAPAGLQGRVKAKLAEDGLLEHLTTFLDIYTGQRTYEEVMAYRPTGSEILVNVLNGAPRASEYHYRSKPQVRRLYSEWSATGKTGEEFARIFRRELDSLKIRTFNYLLLF